MNPNGQLDLKAIEFKLQELEKEIEATNAMVTATYWLSGSHEVMASVLKKTGDDGTVNEEVRQSRLIDIHTWQAKKEKAEHDLLKIRVEKMKREFEMISGLKSRATSPLFTS